jgi:hypothetical protein
VRRTVERVAVECDADPTPADYLADEETSRAVASLDDGWVALTDTELLRYHPGGEPPLVRVERPNVAALTLGRTGGDRVFALAPRLVAAGVGALVAGAALRGFSLPTSAAEGPGAESVGSLLGVLTTALSTLATGLLLGGVGLLFVSLLLVGVTLSRRRTELAVERASGDALTCPVSERSGRRALRALEPALAAGEGDGSGDGVPGTERAAQSSAGRAVERSSSR